MHLLVNIWRDTVAGAEAEARVRDPALVLTIRPCTSPGLWVKVMAVVTPSASHRLLPPYMLTRICRCERKE